MIDPLAIPSFIGQPDLAFGIIGIPNIDPPAVRQVSQVGPIGGTRSGSTHDGVGAVNTASRSVFAMNPLDTSVQ